ncbi:hypothetical protein [Facklamia sp. 7083-14-GEN3]|uniref:hypothetical protein n=1 Tax=Facklamia sp. 7083-14-GEN3 TaxID=2973478 RepID=UPI00215B9637|nr:hypothetical protein [Facklamia sp. 7083-14-GEN3]MCR8969128.1 hypothetical protein [Facklamia sp. 7083-14-GEN3]
MQNSKTERYLKLFRKIYIITFILGFIPFLTVIVAKIAYPNPLFTLFSKLTMILFAMGLLFFMLALVLAVIQIIKKKGFTNEIELPLLTGFIIRILFDYFQS